MKIAILGASRGLGAALVQTIQKDEKPSILFLSARDSDKLKGLARDQDQIHAADFTKQDQQERLTQALVQFNPHKIFYVAGGGPYGPYPDKERKDHAWALELNLIFPAFLIHKILKNKKTYASLSQFVVVGSAIAGQNPDPKASAYAAAKHGIRGLITSLQKENHTIQFVLFEPGYMNTSMLPADAWPRQQGLVKDPYEEARKLWQQCQS